MGNKVICEGNHHLDEQALQQFEDEKGRLKQCTVASVCVHLSTHTQEYRVLRLDTCTS